MSTLVSRRAGSNAPQRPFDWRAYYAGVNAAALAAFPAVLARILPGGRIERGEYIALNPTRADKNLGSFRTNIRSGKWADFATGDRGGDPVSLTAYVAGLSQFEAAKRLAQLLGI